MTQEAIIEKEVKKIRESVRKTIEESNQKLYAENLFSNKKR